jgi:hypothetical protein
MNDTDGNIDDQIISLDHLRQLEMEKDLIERNTATLLRWLNLVKQITPKHLGGWP